jgi:hypothetical protein
MEAPMADVPFPPSPDPRPRLLACWSPPRWADAVSALGDHVEAFATLGSVGLSAADGASPLFVVFLAQRDEVSARPGAITVRRGPAEVVVGGVRLTAAEAGDLARLLTRATSLLAEAAG